MVISNFYFKLIAMREETISERIQKIMKEEGHTVSTFARKLGISWTTANNIIAGKNAPNYDTIINILENFSTVDANWLLLGKECDTSIASQNLYTIINNQQRTIEAQQKTIDRLTERIIGGNDKKEKNVV